MSTALTMDDPTGDARRLERALEAEIPRLRSHVARLLGHPARSADAEDVLQEVLARAWRYRASFEERRALGPWLRRTALHVVLDRRDARARAPRQGEVDPADVPAAASVDAAAQREQLERLLAPLSAVEREALVRFHQRGESVAEIARTLGLPEGTVKSHLSRARRKLARRKEDA